MRVSTVYLGDVRQFGNRGSDRAGRGFSGFVRAPPVSFIWRTASVFQSADMSFPKVCILQNWRSAKGAVQVRHTLIAKVRALCRS